MTQEEKIFGFATMSDIERLHALNNLVTELVAEARKLAEETEVGTKGSG